MEKKIFYFDIDGTLTTSQGITPSNIAVLKQLKQLQHTIIISSGRPAWYIKDMFGSYIDGLISSNGRHIEYRNQVLFDDFIDFFTLQTIVSICNEVKCGYLFVGKDTMYLGNRQYITSNLGYTKDVIEDFSLATIEVYMFDIYYRDTAHFEKIKAAFDGLLILNDHHVGSADASSLEINKGTAVTFLTDYLHFNKEDSFAFGDGDNDLQMFQAVKTAIAMGNGSPLAKQHATYITEAIEEEGIKKALIKYQIL